jgi:hypothetical protein
MTDSFCKSIVPCSHSENNNRPDKPGEKVRLRLKNDEAEHTFSADLAQAV